MSSGISFKRFRECTDADFQVDRHIHSAWTDGKSSVAQILQRAREMNLRQIAITDHVRRKSTYCDRYMAEVETLRSGSDIVVLTGFEAKIIDHEGNLDIPPGCAERADLVIGSVHSIPENGGFIPPGEVPPEMLERREFELSMALAASGKADVLGHPGGMSLAHGGRFNPEYMEGIMDACASSGTAFEINTKYHRALMPWLLERLHRHNPPVSLGSDAHESHEIGTCSAIIEQERKSL